MNEKALLYLRISVMKDLLVTDKLTIALLFAHVSWASYARLFQAGVFYAESSMTALGSSCLGTTLNI